MIELRMDPAAALKVRKFNIRFAAVYALFFGLVGLLQLLVGASPAGAVFVAGAVLMVPLTIVLLNRSEKVTAVTFGDGTYTNRTLWETTRFTAAVATRVVTIAKMALGGGIAGSSHHLIVTGTHKRLLILVGQMWSTEQLTALADDLVARGVPMTPIWQPLTPAQLRATDRRLMPWAQAHPFALSALVIAGLLILLVVVFVVLVAIFVA